MSDLPGEPPNWGETPWDNMTREELLREVWRKHAALGAAGQAMALVRSAEINAAGGRLRDWSFWSDQGTGGRALAMTEEAHAPHHDVAFRTFFRYAVDLLFSEGLGDGWMVCPRGHMIGGKTEACMCGLATRPLEWSDLRKDMP